ncbi:hypothetical protein [Fictibacillus sp. KU28468]|uniref:hypothetical protein n=1 Tax=Fictibacillus sp. KU28468 TaxID=2991053 RepID=UPI00223E62C1|nr:hypothetical protein [Fictibacillus sp. KU28468]UZJ79321.1 hypothetical protein OKX00_02180 [Fictibacillus sp. KU28468]
MKTARMLLPIVLMFCFMTPAYAAAPVKEKSTVNLEHWPQQKSTRLDALTSMI